MASDIRAGRAFVEIFLKNSVAGELKKLQKQFSEWGSSITSVGTKLLAFGAGLTAPFGLALGLFNETGSAINDMSIRTGVAADQLQTLGFAAKLSGSSIDDVETSVKKLSKSIVEANDGSATATAAFDKLGLSAADLKTLSPDEQLRRVGAALNAIPDATTRTATAMEILGKSGTSILPMFADGADGLKAMEDNARRLGIVMSNEDVAAADRFGDQLDTVMSQFRAVAIQTGAAVAEAIEPYWGTLQNILATVIQFVREHKSLIVTVATTGVAIAAAGAGLVAFGVTLSGIGIGLGALASVITTVGGLIGTVFAVIASPIGIVIATVLAAVGTFVGFGNVLGEVRDIAVQAFQGVRDTALEAFGGIADALAAGDITTAAQILWTGLQLAFATGTQGLREKWIEFRTFFVSIATDAFFNVLNTWATVKSSIQSLVENLASVMGDIWDGITGTFASTWDTVVNAVAKSINYVQGLFDDSFDSSAANAEIDKQSAADQQARDADAAAKKSARDKDRDAGLKGIEDQKNATIAANDEANKSLQNGLVKNGTDDINGLQKQKDDLQATLDAQRKTAADKRAASKPLDPIKKLNVDAPDVGDITGKAKSIGLFNVAGLQGLQGADPASLRELKRIGDAVERTERNTRDSATFVA